jgi:hypothetical protein
LREVVVHRIIPERSQVWIHARSTLHPIDSSTTGLEGWIRAAVTAKGALDLSQPVGAHLELPVGLLRGSNPLEEREMKRRINARRYPTIDGELTSVEAAGEADQYVVTGDLTFYGTTRPCTDTMTITVNDDGVLHLEGESTFDVRDFGMQPPRILMIRVEPVVRVRVAIDAAPE